MKIATKIALLAGSVATLVTTAIGFHYRWESSLHAKQQWLAALQSRWLVLNRESLLAFHDLAGTESSFAPPAAPAPGLRREADADAVHRRFAANAAAIASLAEDTVRNGRREGDREEIALGEELQAAVRALQDAIPRPAAPAERGPAVIAQVRSRLLALQQTVDTLLQHETGETKREEDLIRFRLAFLAGGILALLGLISLVLYRDVARPLRDMAASARQISPDTIGHRFRLDRRDELGAVAAAFDQMLASLEATMVSRDELEHLVDTRTLELERLGLVARHTTNAVVITDHQGRIESVNAGFERLTGYTAAEVRGRKPGDILQGPGTDSATVRQLGERLRSGQPASAEILNYAKGGRPYWVQLNIQPVRGPHGQLTQFIAIESDITERRRAEAELESYKDRLELALKSARSCTFDYDIRAFAVTLDPGWSAMLGEEPHETRLSPRRLLNITHPADRRDSIEQAAACVAGHTNEYRAEYRIRHRQGHWIWFHSHGRVVERDANGRARRIIGTNTDITERKAAEFAVAQQVGFLNALNQITLDVLERRQVPELLQALVEHAAVLVGAPYVELLLKEEDRFVVRAHTRNQESLHGTQVRREDAPLVWRAHDTRLPVVIDNVPEQIHGLRTISRVEGIASIVKVPVLLSEECIGVLALRRNGSGRPFDDDEVQKALLLARLAALTVTNARIYEDARREAEIRTIALRESEARFRGVFDRSPIAIALISIPEGRVVEVNEAGLRMFDHPHAGVVGRTTAELGLWSDLSDRDSYYTQLGARGFVRDFQARMRRRDGAEITVLCSGSCITIGDRSYSLNSLQDITARQRSEDALRASEDRFRVLADLSPVGIFSSDADGRCNFVNRRWCEMAGLSEAEAHGDGWLDAVHPDDRAGIAEGWTAAVRRGEASTAEFRFQRRNGAIVHLMGQARPQLQPDGTVVGFVGTVTDVTSIRLAHEERHRLEEQLRQAQKMESLGTLAGGIAHDFNNILTGIFGFVQLARLDLPDDHPAAPWLDSITAGSNRARDLVQQILTFSRKKEGAIAPLRLQPVVIEALKLLRSTVPAMVELRQEIDPDCPPVMADGTQIHQIVMNLCTNALHAMPEPGGLITVELQVRQVESEETMNRPGLRPGAYVRLSVRDNGHGMSAGTVSRIFEPFFTTKEPGKGSGLGLAVVHGIVQSHGGAIFVRSNLGQGTEFEIYLPAIPAPDRSTPPLPPAASLPRGNHQHVLFVDDEVAVGSSLGKLIRQLGYAVTIFHNPQHALARLRAGPGDFDLVVTDLAMPGLPGNLLAEQVKALRPDLPVVLISGFIAPDLETQLLASGVSAVLHKPPTLPDLARTLADRFAT